MRIRLGTLKKVLQEVALSPSVFKNNKPVNEPQDKPNVNKAMQELEGAFRRGLELNLVVSMADSYNEQSGQFDDAAYERVKKAVSDAVDTVNASVAGSMNKAWTKAHADAKGAPAQKQQQPQKPAPTQQPQQAGRETT